MNVPLPGDPGRPRRLPGALDGPSRSVPTSEPCALVVPAETWLDRRQMAIYPDLVDLLMLALIAVVGLIMYRAATPGAAAVDRRLKRRPSGAGQSQN